jgi:hypothetical protein
LHLPHTPLRKSYVYRFFALQGEKTIYEELKGASAIAMRIGPD